MEEAIGVCESHVFGEFLEVGVDSGIWVPGVLFLSVSIKVPHDYCVSFSLEREYMGGEDVCPVAVICWVVVWAMYTYEEGVTFLWGVEADGLGAVVGGCW